MKRLVMALTLVGLVGCSPSPNLLSGEQVNLPFGQEFVDTFNQSNGSVFCVPDMDPKQANVFSSVLYTRITEIDAYSLTDEEIGPMEETGMSAALRLALAPIYPCNKPVRTGNPLDKFVDTVRG